jgi:hypothetical protein
LKWPLSSVCSVLHAVSDRVESNGDFEAVTWANGHTTRRERFRVKKIHRASQAVGRVPAAE